MKGSPKSRLVKERYANGERYSQEALESMRQKRINHFLVRAEIIHGNKFSYPHIERNFVTAKTQISVHCNTHDLAFQATPDNHLCFAGGKCPACGKAAKSNAAKTKYYKKYDKWLRECLPKHLSLTSDFVDPNEPVTVLCLIHNKEESHKPIYLKNNNLHGCQICSQEASVAPKRLTLEKLVDEVDLPEGIKILGIEQDDPTEKAYRTTFIICSCVKHGPFKITKGSLKSASYACQDCARMEKGYVPQRLARLKEAGELGKPCHIALMKVNVFGITSLKLGVTTRTLEDRYKEALIEVFTDFLLPERLSYTIERSLLERFKSFKDNRIKTLGINQGNRWAGDTELFSLNAQEALSFALKREVVKQKAKFDLI